MGLVVLVLVAVGFAAFLSWILSASRRKNVPKGTSGWPLIGETLEWWSCNPTDFLAPRVRKYGNVFRTHLFGYNAVMVTDPEVSHLVHLDDGTSLCTGFPNSAMTVFGPQALAFLEGPEHHHLHKHTQSLFFYDNIGPRIPQIEKLIVGQIDTWENRTVLLLPELKKVLLNVSMHMLVGFGIEDDEKLIKEIIELFDPFLRGVYSMPIKIPGTTFYKSLQARRRLEEIVLHFTEARRKRIRQGEIAEEDKDILTKFVELKDLNGNHLSDASITTQIIVLLFGGFHTTANLIAVSMDLLLQNADAYQSLQNEHLEIRQSKKEEHLTLADIRKMKYSSQTIHETLRYPGGAMFVLRKTIQDFDVMGHHIPKNWLIVIPYSGFQQNPQYYSEPTIFDPSRFEDQKLSKNYSPFGGGPHICPGREFAKVVVKIIYHHLILKYRWKRAKIDEGKTYFPLTSPKDGLPMKLVPLKEKLL